MVHHLVPMIPPHHTYVEPFAGAASLFWAKPPSPVEVLNDLNSGLVNFYRVLRDPDQFPAFQKEVSLTPYSREEFSDARESWEQETDPVQKAARWFVLARQSFAGRLEKGGWGLTITESNRGMSKEISSYLGVIDKLPEFHARLRMAQIEHQDFR